MDISGGHSDISISMGLYRMRIINNGSMVELADTLASKACAERREGSTPSWTTRLEFGLGVMTMHGGVQPQDLFDSRILTCKSSNRFTLLSY